MSETDNLRQRTTNETAGGDAVPKKVESRMDACQNYSRIEKSVTIKLKLDKCDNRICFENVIFDLMLSTRNRQNGANVHAIGWRGSRGHFCTFHFLHNF